MSVIMLTFLEKEKLKWIEEIENADGSITYKANCKKM